MSTRLQKIPGVGLISVGTARKKTKKKRKHTKRRRPAAKRRAAPKRKRVAKRRAAPKRARAKKSHTRRAAPGKRHCGHAKGKHPDRPCFPCKMKRARKKK